MNSTQYSISAAARIAGRGRATIDRHCKSGKLSYTVNNEGNKQIEASELLRAYGDDCDFEREEKRSRRSATNRSEIKSEPPKQTAIDEVRAEQIQQFQSQIEYLQQALDKAQEGQNRVTLLLERRASDKGDWQAAIEKLSKKHEQELKQLRRALYHERNKSWWQRIVGN